MKDYIEEIVDKKFSLQDNTNRIREYIQKFLLYILYKRKLYKDLVFVGGTALRFLYGIKRFSENLDFSLSYKAKKYDFKNILKTAEEEFIASGYKIEIKYDMSRNVHNAFLKFPGLLFEYGLSPHKGEKISIKVEIDTNPPEGGREEVTLYNSIFMVYILHYDLPSLFAGKLHALLCREYTKGRDWYDLLWYLTTFKELEPNFVMLNKAIGQTMRKPFQIDGKNWKDKLKGAIDNLDIKKAKNDVRHFLENPVEIELLTKKNLYKQILQENPFIK
ncbi:MAG: nucleotidyl transferase AbiEii/AbiGii toxin family protein [Candidatus Aerophobetes bacterium]|nr:nucleotidyl transferase AbiEii/AbiGii toxin family protein [Candidatus Aerophobetes bacterium]